MDYFVGQFVLWRYLSRIWSPVTDMQHNYCAKYPTDDCHLRSISTDTEQFIMCAIVRICNGPDFVFSLGMLLSDFHHHMRRAYTVNDLE